MQLLIKKMLTEVKITLKTSTLSIGQTPASGHLMQFRFSLLIRGAQQSEKTASLLKSMQGNDSEPETGKQMVESKERRGRREAHIKLMLTFGTSSNFSDI